MDVPHYWVSFIFWGWNWKKLILVVNWNKWIDFQVCDCKKHKEKTVKKNQYAYICNSKKLRIQEFYAKFLEISTFNHKVWKWKTNQSERYFYETPVIFNKLYRGQFYEFQNQPGILNTRKAFFSWPFYQ